MKDTCGKDDWRSLCELASKESDPQKLLELITKINRALEECHRRNRPNETSLKVDIVLLPTDRSSRYDLDVYDFPGKRSAPLEYDC